MSIFFISTLSVLLAEMGDKTQLLTLLLVIRFGKSWTIFLAILVATLFNHLLAAAAGDWLSQLINPNLIRWLVCIGFIIMAVWLLFPDKGTEQLKGNRPFWSSLMLFFLAEMGDKTQVATLLLAAHYHQTVLVVVGSITGILLANAPVIWFGRCLQPYMQSPIGRYSAAALFFLLALLTKVYD